MAASAEVDALPALREAPGVSRCEVDVSLLRGFGSSIVQMPLRSATTAWFSSAHRPRPPPTTINRSHVRGGTRTGDDWMRPAQPKRALGSRWQESCLSSGAPGSLRVLLQGLRAVCGSGNDKVESSFCDGVGVIWYCRHPWNAVCRGAVQCVKCCAGDANAREFPADDAASASEVADKRFWHTVEASPKV
jgi:hypothetical protein